jgi:phospholipid/cholesterol/gamma-HCH transport system ATP-binding protein
MIEVRDLSIGYGGNVLLHDLNFDVAGGDVFVILGGSGCGKSTLLRHLVGLEQPMAGTIRFACAPTARDGGPPFGVLFQSGALLGSLTVAENVALPLQRWTDLPLDAIGGIVAAKLRLVGLEGYENHLPAEISGGMKKRAAWPGRWRSIRRCSSSTNRRRGSIR